MRSSACEELFLQLKDTAWPYTYTDHERQIARAIVFDGEGFFYFVRVHWDDQFGKGVFIETSGGGIEAGEEPETAIRRELKEELGAEIDVICKLGVVSDYYNLIHRHNVNHYYLCKLLSVGSTSMTEEEIRDFQLSALRLRYEEAAAEYRKNAATPWGSLLCQRELPILERAKKILEEL